MWVCLEGYKKKEGNGKEFPRESPSCPDPSSLCLSRSLGIMQAEIYMLDVAERGESQGNIALDIRRDDQRHVPPTFETMSDSKSPETESQKEELGEYHCLMSGR